MADQTGTIKITKLEINGRDFYPAFTSCSIYEDMFRNTWSGHIDIIETESVRETMPIIGEEDITIEFASVKPVAGVKDNIIQFIGRVTKLDAYREGTGSQRRYRLHFQSLWAEANKGKRVRKVYEGTATDIASKILKSQIGGKDFETLDAALYKEKFIFPNWSPFQCINFLSGMALSKKYNDPAYLFYEDRDGFHLTTLSQLMDKEKVDTVKVRFVQDPKDEAADETLVSSIQLDPLFDTLENLELGMYGGTIITYDKINKKFVETTATYSDTYGQFKHVAKEKLTIQKPESPKNRFQFVMTNELENPGVYSEAKEWALKQAIRGAQIRGHRAHLYLNRSTNYKLGDILEWDLRTTQDSNTPDKILSGKWMITRIRHTFNQVNYNAHVELIKDGRG